MPPDLSCLGAVMLALMFLKLPQEGEFGDGQREEFLVAGFEAYFRVLPCHCCHGLGDSQKQL